MTMLSPLDHEVAIDAAARALYDRDRVFPSGWDDQSETVQEDYRGQAESIVDVLTPVILKSVSGALVAKFGVTNRGASFVSHLARNPLVPRRIA